MAEKMTVREAYQEVVLGEPSDWGSPPTARYARARAIVDALVEAHEAKCAFVDSSDPRHATGANERVGQTFQFLRKLERGEGEV